MVKVRRARSMSIVSQPTMQGLSSARDTTAAWLRAPPVAVTTPFALSIPRMSLGLVVGRTRMTSSPFAAASAARSESSIAAPCACPGDEPRPWASTLASASALLVEGRRGKACGSARH